KKNRLNAAGQSQEAVESRPSPGVPCLLKNLEHVVVVESRDDRRDRDAGENAGLGDRLQRRQALGDGRRLGLHLPGRLIVGEGDAQEYSDRSLLVELPKEIKIAQDERGLRDEDRKSTRLNSSHEWISYAVFCLK